MNYQETLDYIYSYIDPARTGPLPDPSLNLRRTEALLAAFGNPQHHVRSVVVAGTKGKGSTCAMIESIVRAAGFRTGLWTSPHLHSYRERIQVNRQLIPETELIRLVQDSRERIEHVANGEYGPPSTFAIGMMLALCYFAEQQVDLAIIEVGLGGRYDSANVVTPLVSVITSISYDHMAFLGQTLAAIAAEKAGILKPSIPAVTIRQRHEVQQVLERTAQEVGTTLDIVGNGVATHAALGEIVPKLGLHGAFQRDNAELAIGAMLRLQTAGYTISPTAITTGLAHAQWPARFEVVSKAGMQVVIDGAHNGDSAIRLVAALRIHFSQQQIVWVFGASRDKDLGRMIPALAAASHVWVLTRSGHPRAVDNLGELHERILAEDAAAIVEIHPDPQQAITHAQKLAGPHSIVCITGSLFVAAAAREVLGLVEERDPPVG